tara:strand:+ start:1889 stop:2392 length:504 start_codon:yes stop_codon:yes gene_type:complete
MGSRHTSANEPLNDLKSAVAEDIKHARDTLARDGKEAAEKLKDSASEQAHFAAHQLSGIGQAMEKVGSEMEGSDQPHVGKYVRKAGGSVSAFAHKMEGRDASSIARSIQDFGRDQPLAFLGLAALAGLTASRFMVASADRPAADETPESRYAATPASATTRPGDFNG